MPEKITVKEGKQAVEKKNIGKQRNVDNERTARHVRDTKRRKENWQ